MKKPVSVSSVLYNSLIVLLLIGVGLFASVFNTEIGWQLVYLFCVLLIFCLLSIWTSLDNLTLRKQGHQYFFKADDRNLTVCVQTKTKQKKMFPRLCAEIKLKEDWYEMTLLESSSVVSSQWQFLLDIDKEFARGAYENLPTKLKSSDMFKLFRKERILISDLSFSVMPILEIGRAKEVFFLLDQHQLIPLPNTMIQSFDIKNFRNYREGDHSGQIDWKLSAKKQNFIVKELEVELDNERKSDILLLFFGQPDPKFETFLSIFYSFYLEYNEKFDKQRLLLVDEESDSLQQPTREIVAKIQPLSSGEIGLEIVKKAQIKEYKIVIFTPVITKEIVGLQQELGLVNEVSVIFLTDSGELIYN